MREGSRFCLLKLRAAVRLPQVAAGEPLQGVSPRKAWDTGLPPAVIAEGRDKAQKEASDEGAAGASKEKPGALAWAAPLRRGAGPSCRQQDCNHCLLGQCSACLSAMPTVPLCTQGPSYLAGGDAPSRVISLSASHKWQAAKNDIMAAR